VRGIFVPATPRSNIEQHLPRVLAALAGQGLGDPLMTLVALATIRAESEGFAPISEGVSQFNTAAGQHPFNLYDSRADLGNRGRPDGERFKGRGFVQLTGRNNYADIGAAIGLGTALIDNPDLANDPDTAARILAAFLKREEGRIRSGLAQNDLRAVRKAVNGGSHGLDRFKDCFERGRAELGV
jgi:peptidoglycan L-alanyl-D-glutamate endopeptidase CwlK